MSEWLFYSLACLLIIASLLVAFCSHPMHSVLSLIAAFIVTSIIWLCLGAEFLALALLFIYVGAVMVLFLFIVFMLNMKKLHVIPLWVKLVSMVMFAWLIRYWMGRFSVSQPISMINEVENTKVLGIRLYTEYIYSLEILGCILLTAMVSVIQMVTKRHSIAKRQDINLQINRDKKDCITWM